MEQGNPYLITFTGGMQVSVIIPAYNAEAWLERALASVLAQQEVDLEVIMVDNNSTDATVALMENFRSKHPHLVRIARATRQGSAAARNEGLRLARGEWIQYLDADDTLLPGKLTRQLALVTPETDWVIGACIRRDLEGNETVSTLNEDPWKGLVYNGGVGHTNSNLIRRSMLLGVGGQREELPNGVDNDLYFRLLQAGAKVVLDHQPGAMYLDRAGYRLSSLPGSVSRQRTVHLVGDVLRFLAEHHPDYLKQHLPFFNAALVIAIRVLATEHLPEAKKCQQLYFPEGFRNVPLAYDLLPRFARWYSVVGFAAVETLRRISTHFIPPAVRKIVKG